MLLERGDDLLVAGALLSDAREGQGSLLLVEGPAGIGKSALIGALRGRALGEGCLVLSARGAELERDFSYGVVRQLLEPALASASHEEREGLLAGAARLAEPAIGELTAGLEPEPSSASPSRDPSFAVLHGLYWLTANLSERGPLLACVDDAHWAHAASLRFLAYLAGRLQGLRAMLVVGVRRFEPGAPAELIAALAAETSAHEMRLAPLTEEATDALVRSRRRQCARPRRGQRVRRCQPRQRIPAQGRCRAAVGAEDRVRGGPRPACGGGAPIAAERRGAGVRAIARRRRGARTCPRRAQAQGRRRGPQAGAGSRGLREQGV